MPAPTPSEITVPADFSIADWLTNHAVNDQLTVLVNKGLIRITKKGADSLDIEYFNECGDEELTKYEYTREDYNAVLDGTSLCDEVTPTTYEENLTEMFEEDGYTNLTFATNNNLKWYDVQGTFEY